MSQTIIQVAVAASVLAVRVGLRSLLQNAGRIGDSPVQVVWEAASLAELVDGPRGPDVIVLTDDLLDRDGLPGLDEIFRDQDGHIALLLLTRAVVDLQNLSRLPLRAWGILPLDAGENELTAAVQALHVGLCVGSPMLFQPLLADRPFAGRDELEPLIEQLTEREGQVLQLLAQGLANKQIAYSLNISEHTVKFHLSSLFSKLGAGSRTEAIRLGIQRGLVVL